MERDAQHVAHVALPEGQVLDHETALAMGYALADRIMGGRLVHEALADSVDQGSSGQDEGR